MRIYTCAPEWEAMLTCIYEAFACRLGHNNVKLMLEPVEQLTLFDEYIHVSPDAVKAGKVIESINRKISPNVYHEMSVTAMSDESDALDNIYHILILGFAYGADVLNRYHFKDVARNQEIRARVGREIYRFQEIARFHRIGESFIAHIEPRCRIVEPLGPIFADRMPSENFMIIDDCHLEAAVHPKNQDFYLWKLTAEELASLLMTEEANDEYTDMWKLFFDSIAIKERKNYRCQVSHFPLWSRTHAVEFQ